MHVFAFLTRTHTCHLPLLQGCDWLCTSEKTYRRSLFDLLPSFWLGFSPQEPRRPRFSFFHLHAVKELTLDPCGHQRHRKPRLPEFWGQNVASGCPAASLPFRYCAEQWERSSLGVVNVAGCSRDVSVCQHPISIFRKVRILKT